MRRGVAVGLARPTVDVAPEVDCFFWDLFPVDFVVDFVWRATSAGLTGSINVVLDRREERQRNLRAFLRRTRGVAVVAYDEWRERMLADPSLPIYPLRGFFPPAGGSRTVAETIASCEIWTSWRWHALTWTTSRSSVA